MILSHGSNTEIQTIDLSFSLPYKDFGKGFYLTSIFDQAEKMAWRTVRFYGGVPVVTSFSAPNDLLLRVELNVRVFESTTEEWARFVINNRNRDFRDEASPECNADGKYDIVFGPVGDDDVTYLLRQYMRGAIGDGELRKGLKYKKASDQFSFHTKKAVSFLKREDFFHV